MRVAKARLSLWSRQGEGNFSIILTGRAVWVENARLLVGRLEFDQISFDFLTILTLEFVFKYPNLCV